MKKLVLALVGVSAWGGLLAQTVFTYGKNNVPKDEFIRAFNKNPNVTGDRKKALKEYLDLYTNFKLKVQAAYDEGLDKDATQQYELQNFKRQIADNIINDQANVKNLVKEAFERSQKEIHLAQVFVEVPTGTDSAKAFATINTAYNELKSGKNFGEVAASYSSDESVRQTQGDLGFITAFSLPYEIENLVYNLKPGANSGVVKTRIGYHIFKNMGERKSQGTRRIAQIMIAVPPTPTEAQKRLAMAKADSIYNLLKKGDNFATLVATESNDLSTVPTKGEMPEFTTGTYSSAFEEVAFSLKNTGDISRPFETPHGIHILKLLEAKAAPTDLNDGTVYAAVQEKVSKDSRLEKSKNDLIDKKLSLIKYKPGAVKEKELMTYTDSAIHNKSLTGFKTITENTVLFSFAKQNIKVSDWIKYIKASQMNTEAGEKNYSAFYKTFTRISADDYYRNNLGDYDEDYVRQVKEFQEANLLFGIMEKNVWSKANNDSTGLQDYYQQHKAKYVWPASADAITVTCTNEKTATEVKDKLQRNPAEWRQVTGSYGTDVIADSSRYELSQLSTAPADYKDGMTTASVKNQQDNSYTFSYIVKLYKEPGQRSFEDARGMVISDYQQVLEDKWLASLKKKYPVKVNDAVFAGIK